VDYFINYGRERKFFSMPAGWNLISYQDKPPIFGVTDPLQEIRRALDHPMAEFCTRSGGAIIWVAPQKEAGSILPLIKEMGSSESASDFHRRLIENNIPDHLRVFGISYMMQVVYFKELAEKFTMVHVTEGLSPDQVKMMKFSYSPNVQEAIHQVSKKMSEADVAVFPSGGNIIPEVHLESIGHRA